MSAPPAATPVRRRGTSLVELLVALPLGAIAVAMATILVIRLARASRTQGAQLAAARELRHAYASLRDDLEPLDARDVVTVSDSVLEVHTHLGVLQLCAQPSATDLIVATPMGSGDAWVTTLRSGDAARGWHAQAEAGAPPVDRTRTIASLASMSGTAPCGAAATAPVRRWRLTVADSHPNMAVGTPVIVQRAVRYQHYRSGNSWWLGRRTRNGMLWEGLQPVAGPLLSSVQRGLQAWVVGASGEPVGPDSAVAFRITLRVLRRAGAPGVALGGLSSDSLSAEVVLRAAAYRRGVP